MAPANVMRIVVAGHVDHGKSTLIGRLLHDLGRAGEHAGHTPWAHTLDQLDQERHGELTVETTQAVIELDHLRLVFIDVPGHRELIDNMLTGTTRADTAVLVVAADHGVGAQTRTHADLLALLGIDHLIVCVNKMDAVDYAADAFERAATAVTDCCTALGLRPTAVLPVSAEHGDNLLRPSAHMPWCHQPPLCDCLQEARAEAPRDHAARVGVQDVYDPDGERLAAVRVLSGSVNQGDELTRLPIGRSVRVQQVRRFPHDDRPATAPECVALQLGDSPVQRGDILAGAPLPDLSDAFHARLFWMGKAPLHVGDQLLWRCSTQAVNVRVDQLSAPVDPGSFADVRLCASVPVVIESDGELSHFALEQSGAPVAVGRVLDTGRR